MTFFSLVEWDAIKYLPRRGDRQDWKERRGGSRIGPYLIFWWQSVTTRRGKEMSGFAESFERARVYLFWNDFKRILFAVEVRTIYLLVTRVPSSIDLTLGWETICEGGYSFQFSFGLEVMWSRNCCSKKKIENEKKKYGKDWIWNRETDAKRQSDNWFPRLKAIEFFIYVDDYDRELHNTDFKNEYCSDCEMICFVTFVFHWFVSLKAVQYIHIEYKPLVKCAIAARVVQI